jgi:centrosomal protein CEP135
MERAEKVKRKLRSLEYPPLNPKDPWPLIDKLLNDLLKASEGYQFVKLKMRELKEQLEMRSPEHQNLKLREIENDNDRLHSLLIQRDKEIAMLRFQKNEGLKSVDLEMHMQMELERDARSEPGLDREKRLLEFNEFVKVCNAYETELLRLRGEYEHRPRMNEVMEEGGVGSDQRRKVLENQVEFLTVRNMELEDQLKKEREQVERLRVMERRVSEMKDQLTRQVFELRQQVKEEGRGSEERRTSEVNVSQYEDKIVRLEGEMQLMAKDIEEKDQLIQEKERELQMMQKEVNLKGGFIATLEGKIEDLKKFENTMEEARGQKELQVKQLENEVDSLRGDLVRLEGENQKKDEEMKEMRERNRELVRASGDLQLSLKQKEIENVTIKKRMEIAETQVVDLKMELKEVEEKEQNNFKKILQEHGEEKIRKELEERINFQEKKNKDLEDEMEVIRKQKHNIERELIKAREDLKQLQDEQHRELEGIKGRGQRENQSVQRKLRHLEDQKNLKVNELTNQVKRLLEKEGQLNRDLQDIRSVRAKLEDENKTLREDIDLMSRNVEKQSRLNFQIESEKFEQRQRIQELERERQDLRKKNQELIKEGQIRGVSMEQGGTRETRLLRELEKEKNQNNQLKQDLANLNGKLREMDIKRDRLEEELDKKTEDLDVLRSEMKTLIGGYEERVNEINLFSNQVLELEAELDREREQGRRVGENCDNVKREFEQVRKVKEQEKDLRIEMEGDLQILNRENKQLANEVYALERKMEGLGRKYTESQELVRVLESELEVLKLETSQIAKTCNTHYLIIYCTFL